jgi:hypothetical protein
MQLTLKTACITALSTVSTVLLAHSTTARPYPDHVGVCYRFQGDTQDRMEPCVISSGYGAAGHYAVLHWSDGTLSTVAMLNSCDPAAFDANGFCAYTVNDEAAEYYERDVFMAVATRDDQDNMPCYRFGDSDTSICYRIQ